MLRMLSLTAFAVLALVVGAYEEDEMTLLIGGATVLAAVASLPRWKMSTCSIGSGSSWRTRAAGPGGGAART